MEAIYAELEAEGVAAIRATSVRSGEVAVARAADMRYVGQEHAVTVDLPKALFKSQDRDGIKRHFDEVHERRYGTSAPAERAELVSLRTTVTAVMAKPALGRIREGKPAPADGARRGSRPVFFSETAGFKDTPTFARDGLLAGNRIAGPALIEEHASTTVVQPGDEVAVDAFGNLVISVGGGR
jgi:N-methylhydantoinase A